MTTYSKVLPYFLLSAELEIEKRRFEYNSASLLDKHITFEKLRIAEKLHSVVMELIEEEKEKE